MGNSGFAQLSGTYNNTNKPWQIVASNVTAIAAGIGHSLFLKQDVSLWAMGLNADGQLGDGTTNNASQPEQIVASNVLAVVAGKYHSLFLKNDGSLWVMGLNNFGQLGDGTFISTNFPEQIVANNVSIIAAGGWHSLFVRTDGSLWAFGYNGAGALGDGHENYFLPPNGIYRPEQIRGPYNHICGQVLADGDMRLSSEGFAGADYVLDWAITLSPANWLPLVTNPATSYGALVFTNSPASTTNNLWRIRSVP